jgi:hypothetical protein
MNKRPSALRKLLPGLIFPLLVTAFGVYVVVASFGYQFETRAFANGTGIIMVIMSVSVLVREIVRGLPQSRSKEEPPGAPAVRRVPPLVFALAWCVAFFIAVLFVGYVVAVPLWVFALLLWNRASWPATLLIPILLLVMVKLVLEKGLDIFLFQGVLFGDRLSAFW